MNLGRAFLFVSAALLASACERQQPTGTPPGALPPPATPPASAAAPAPAQSAAGPAESTGRKIGQEVDDGVISAKVKAALLGAEDLKGLEIEVETEKAVVQLSGFVSSQAEIDRAGEIARGIEGVRSVENKLSIKPR